MPPPQIKWDRYINRYIRLWAVQYYGRIETKYLDHFSIINPIPGSSVRGIYLTDYLVRICTWRRNSPCIRYKSQSRDPIIACQGYVSRCDAGRMSRRSNYWENGIIDCPAACAGSGDVYYLVLRETSIIKQFARKPIKHEHFSKYLVSRSDCCFWLIWQSSVTFTASC